MEGFKNVVLECLPKNRWTVAELELMVVSVIACFLFSRAVIVCCGQTKRILRVYPDVHCVKKDKSGGWRSLVGSQGCEHFL